MRCLAVCHTELVGRLLDAVLTPSVRARSPGREPGAGPALRRRRLRRHVSATPSGSTPTSAPTSLPAPASSSKTTAARSLRKVLEAVRDAGGALVWVLGTSPEDADRADGAARRRFPRSPASRWPSSPGRRSLTELGRSRHPAARAAVPALLQRRRPRAHPAAQRSRPRRHRQRPGAAQHAAPHAADGDHRLHARRDAGPRTCGCSSCSTCRSRSITAEQIAVVRRDRARRRPAALFRRGCCRRSIW